MSVAEPTPNADASPGERARPDAPRILATLLVAAACALGVGPLVVLALHGDSWWAVAGFAAWMVAAGWLADRVESAAAHPGAARSWRLLGVVRRYMTHT